ncbi:MAG: molecular chaperone HtpG, partial [Duncaniella sp.]|nr:molecular chaperone HtpG [Duncaniella sp.]
QNEYMRRMKDMAATQAGMSFYAELPDNYNLIVNTSQAVVASVLADAEKALDDKIAPLRATVNADNEKLTALRAEIKDNKPTAEQETQEKELMASVDKARKEQETIISHYAKGLPKVKQMIDLALLGNGLLQGRELSDFIRRSVEML